MASSDLTLALRHLPVATSAPLSAPRAMLGLLVDRLDVIALCVLLIAAAFPAQAPTVGQVLSQSGGGFWNARLGPANAFELMLIAIAVVAVMRALVTPLRGSSFDRPLLGAALILLALQLVALPRHLGSAEYVPLDVERMLLPIAAYLIVTRAVHSLRGLRIFTFALGGVIALRAIELVLAYGGTTEFGTITGGSALLITEDTLLVMLPLALAWGALVDGRLGLTSMLGALLLVAVLLGIDLLSLRRGAMILIGGALLARSLGLGRRRILQSMATLLILFALGVAAGPGRPLLHQLRYTAVSSLLRTKDASSGQRTAEITSFVDNMDGIDWITGHGVGTSWNAYAKAPLDALSYGTGESEFTRIGWHVYGLDWTYKFGLAGVAVALFALFMAGRRLWRVRKRAEPTLRTPMYSLAVCAPAFLLVMFTNPRVATLAGAVVGLLSCCCDFADQTSTSPSGRRGSAASSTPTSAA